MPRDELSAEEREMLSSGMIHVDNESAAVGGMAARDEGEGDQFDGLSRELDVLHSFHVEVARRFENALSSGLQRLVDIQLRDVQGMTYSQFAFSRGNPTCLVVLQATPLPAPLALDFSPSLLFPLIDCMLGGGKRACAVPERPATELEQRLVRRIAEMLLEELHDAWETVLAVNLTVDRIESNAQRVRLVAPSDPIVQLSFQVRVAEQSGDLTLCLPRRAIRKMVDKLLVGEYRRSDTSQIPAAHLAADSKELVVRVEAEKLTREQLGRLCVGDIIPTKANANDCFDVLIDGHLTFAGRPGALGGRRAVELKLEGSARSA